MKRSEALNLIKSLIDAGEIWADLDTRAENMLAHLEQAGFVPEKIPTYTPSGRLWNYMHQWESESETDFYTDKEWRNRYGHNEE